MSPTRESHQSSGSLRALAARTMLRSGSMGAVALILLGALLWGGRVTVDRLLHHLDVVDGNMNATVKAIEQLAGSAGACAAAVERTCGPRRNR